MPKSPADIFDCKNLAKFMASIVYSLPYHGASLSKFYICEYKSIRFLTKLCFYRKTPSEIYGKQDKLMSHTDAEIKILELFRDNIIAQGITPCILEMVYYHICQNADKFVPSRAICDNITTDYKVLNDATDVEQIMCKYRDLIKNGLAWNKCAFLVMEKCDFSFGDYLEKSIAISVNVAVFKSLLFMIIYTIYAINKIYPGFKHNDLHTDNIMLKIDPNYKFKATDPKFVTISVDNKIFTVPYFGIVPKIIDFGFSVVPDADIISNFVEDKEQMYYRSPNDLMLLFHWIYHTTYNANLVQAQKIHDILAALEPNKLYIRYYTEQIRHKHKAVPSYKQMVHNPIFHEYNVTVPPEQIHHSYVLG